MHHTLPTVASASPICLRTHKTVGYISSSNSRFTCLGVSFLVFYEPDRLILTSQSDFVNVFEPL